jgi:hypothetical protein
MKNILKLSLAAAIVIGVNLEASEAELKNEISILKAQIEDLKKNTDESIDELYERADANEFEATMNRIKWGGGIEISVNNYEGTTGSMSTPMGNIPGKSYSNSNKWTNKLKLTMEAKINDRTKFTGRLSMYKNWADSTPSSMLSDPNEGKTSNSGTSGLFVERAYVDYKINDTFIATIGRQPSSDGPGLSLKENTPRQATYPALLFDGNADGLVLTANAGNIKGALKNIKFRAAYGKGFQQDDSMSGFLANDNSVDDLDVAGAFAETSFDIANMGENLLVLSYVKATNFVGNSLNVDTPNNVNLGDFDLMGIYFENNKAFGTALSYFLSYGYSKGNSNGKTVNYGAMTGNQNVALVDGSSSAYHVGFRYDFAKILKFGYEFNHGGKNWFSFTQGSEDPMNKLATRGDVHDVYAIYQMDLNQYLRVGYTDIQYDYTGSGWHIGSAMPTDDEAKRAYLVYNVKF